MATYRIRKSCGLRQKSRSAEDIDTAVQDKRKNDDTKIKELMNLPAGEIKLWGMDILLSRFQQARWKRPNPFMKNP